MLKLEQTITELDGGGALYHPWGRHRRTYALSSPSDFAVVRTTNRVGGVVGIGAIVVTTQLGVLWPVGLALAIGVQLAVFAHFALKLPVSDQRISLDEARRVSALELSYWALVLRPVPAVCLLAGCFWVVAGTDQAPIAWLFLAVVAAGAVRTTRLIAIKARLAKTASAAGVAELDS